MIWSTVGEQLPLPDFYCLTALKSASLLQSIQCLRLDINAMRRAHNVRLHAEKDVPCLQRELLLVGFFNSHSVVSLS